MLALADFRGPVHPRLDLLDRLPTGVLQIPPLHLVG